MKYLLMELKKNFGKKEKHYKYWLIAFFLIISNTATLAQEKVPANPNSLLNMNKSMQAFGFRTQDQWADFWHQNFGKEYPYQIVPDTEQVIPYLMYPYWLGSLYDHFQFSNIKRIGYFAYFINSENGYPDLSYSWTVRNLTEEAKVEDSQVDLVLYCNGKDETDYFLSSEIACNNCIKMVVYYTSKRDSLFSTPNTKLNNADGINVFFPYFSFDKKRAFGLFIKNLYWSFRKQNPEKKLIVTFPVRDTLQFNYLLGLERYIDEIHFANYDHKGMIQNPKLQAHFQKRFKTSPSELNNFQKIVAEIRLAQFFNPFDKEIPEQEKTDQWELYFFGICLIVALILTTILIMQFCCRLNQLIRNYYLFFTLVLMMFCCEILFLFIFMIEEMNYDIWLINTSAPGANYFLLAPLILIFLLPIIKVLQGSNNKP